jgi:uncharacterized protein
MQVKIEEIQDQGLELDEVIPESVLDEALASSAGFVRSKPTVFKGRFRRLPGRVLLKSGFVASVKAPCKRCLKDVEVEVPVQFELNLVSDRKEMLGANAEGDDDGHAPRAGSFMLEDVDSEPFDGKVIHLDPIIREQILLNLPVSVLCQDSCKGLCSACGQDLNVKECGCERKVVDIRLAKLKDVKLH